MRYFFISALISTCLLGVWSQNSQNLPSRLTRRQAERNEISESIGKGVGGDFVPNQQGTSFGLGPIPTHQSPSPTAYALPSGSEVIVGIIRTTFSCDQRIYGYYADPDNSCQVFHICVPNLNLETGLNEVIQYSFFCGNQTVFDQAALACTYRDDALPCSEAPRLYDEVNSKFGITDRPIR